MFILASSVCKSLQYLISTLTQGVKVVTYLGSLVQLCCGEGGTLRTNIPGVCGECAQCTDHAGFAPAHGVCAFSVYTAQAAGCPAGTPSKTGTEFRALPRSKSLGFRFSGTPQRHSFGWACVLCPSQVRAAQATRCLAGGTVPGGTCILITSPVPATQLPMCGCAARQHRLPCAL